MIVGRGSPSGIEERVVKAQGFDLRGGYKLDAGMLVDSWKIELVRNPSFDCGKQGLPLPTGQLGKLGHAYGDLIVVAT